MLRRRDIPNLLTYARVVTVPVCLALMLIDPPFKALALFWIFVAASLTDFLDGYLARKWNAVSPLGALLDPIADKLLVALMLVYLLTVVGTGLFFPVVTILLRELYIAGLREFLAHRQITLPVSKGGKWKTALQMVALALLLFHIAYRSPGWSACPLFLPDIDGMGGCHLMNGLEISALYAGDGGMLLLYLAALLAVTSAISYTRASWKHVRAAK